MPGGEDKLKIMIIGGGGREHAIAWKISQNSDVKRIYCVPGNGGTNLESKCENINLNSIDEYVEFALSNSIDLTIVGPEVPLTLGITDEFAKRGLRIFGPSKRAAMLEGSKSFAKEFMAKYKVKTAAYNVFSDPIEAVSYLKSCEYPVVVKADGLASGKGVVICDAFGTAKNTINEFMVSDIFKGSGKKVVVEEYLEGVEASILSVTDGNTIIPFISAKDHKAAYDGGEGPNTGGMGAIAPNPYCTSGVMEDFRKNIMLPTLEGIKQEELDYIGIIFFGVMITKKGAYLLEYNVRMGDPETQAVLPLMESDFVELIYAAIDKKLDKYSVRWKDEYSCCVAAVSGDYPGTYKTGYGIDGVEKAHNKIFIAGALSDGKELKTSGGRVLCTTGCGKKLEEAREKAYEDIKRVSFSNIRYRNDIGTL
jgi:phosphoribosylamine---glycine ligase